MTEEVYGVVTFKSTHYAIQGEAVFDDNNISHKTIPTPREITYSCGLSLLFILDDLELVKELVDSGQLDIDHIYKYTKSRVNTAEKIL